MSRYEILSVELTRLRARQAVSMMIPAAGAAFLTYSVASAHFIAISFVAAVVTFVVTPVLFHRAWRFLFRPYRRWSDRSADIAAEIATLRRKVAAIFEAYRERAKGQQFKKAYNLAGKSLSELEEALSVGTYREKREVFVTAFMREGIAVRVTASIGSPYRCSSSDNPARWKQHVERLGCDEIRQYHNHPVHNGKTRPSPMDIRTTGTLQYLLGAHRTKLRSLIICWNGLREWKISEYDDKGKYWIHSEFDAAAWQQQQPMRSSGRGAVDVQS